MPLAPDQLTLRERAWLACNDVGRVLQRVAAGGDIDTGAVTHAVDDLRRLLMDMAHRIEELEQCQK